jgi:hypothetical protein
MYPVTPLLSVAVKLVMATVSDEEADGNEKLVITGLVTSDKSGFLSLKSTTEVKGCKVTLVLYFVPLTSIIG